MITCPLLSRTQHGRPVAWSLRDMDEAPELMYDDYQGIDVKDKIVVVFRHEPQELDEHSVFDGKNFTTHATFDHQSGKCQVARRRRNHLHHGSEQPSSRSGRRRVTPHAAHRRRASAFHQFTPNATLHDNVQEQRKRSGCDSKTDRR